MNYNVTFAGQAPRKAVNLGKETLEKIAEDAKYTKPFDSIEKSMLEASDEAAKKANDAIKNTYKPFDLLKAENKKVAVAEESIMTVPFN